MDYDTWKTNTPEDEECPKCGSPLEDGYCTDIYDIECCYTNVYDPS